MAVQITIVGLGQIGASMGLALAAHKDQVTTVGHDKSAETAQRARKLEAVDKVEFNLPNAVVKADIVVLALPTDQIYETLKVVAQDLREDAVLMETSPAKALVTSWAKELLPAKRHYVGLTPALSPFYVEGTGTGIEAAHADLFDHGMMGISAPPGTSGDALQLAASLSTLLGAVPYFADQIEIDGVMASAHLLPELTGAALANFLLNQPGWSDIRKMAGRPFTVATAGLSAGELAGLGAAAANNRQNLVRLLDGLGASLKELRDAIAAGDDKGLRARLEHAGQGRATWWTERARGDWNAVERGGVQMPKARDILKQQIGGLDKLFHRGDRRDQD